MEKNEPIKFDETFKKLFKELSNPSKVRFINYIFKENIPEDEEIALITQSEFIDKNTLNKLYTDLLFEISKIPKYHVEIQGKNDGSIDVRMFSYGLRIAEEDKIETEEETIIIFPKQAIIYFNQNENIKNKKLVIKFNEEDEYIYEYITIKAWEITPEEIEKQKLYMLLPIIISNQKRYKNKTKEEILDFYRKAIEQTVKEENKSDVEMISDTLDYIFAKLVDRSIKNEKEKEEVLDMSTAVRRKTWKEIGEEIVNEARDEGINKANEATALRLLKMGSDIEFVNRATGLSIKRVKELNDSLI